MATRTGDRTNLPIATGERVVLLDVLRGISILGIAFVNAMFFTIPISKLMDWRWGDFSRPDAVTLAAVGVLAELQFIPVFAILFGMGMALQSSRQPSGSTTFRRQYLRRLLVLLGLGVLHGTLLWYGDILALYAIVGVLALWLRNRSSKSLMIIAVIALLVPVLMQLPSLLVHPQRRCITLEARRAGIVAEINRLASTPDPTEAPLLGTQSSQPAAAPDAQETNRRRLAKGEALVRAVNWLFDESSVYRNGRFGEIVLHRTIYYVIFSPMVGLTQVGWTALGCMLLGICLFRHGVFCDSSGAAGLCRRLAIMGSITGGLLESAALACQAGDLSVGWVCDTRLICQYLGGFLMGLGYMGIIATLYRDPVWRRRLAPLAQVGQVSLTNYLASSLLFGLIFYGYGLGLAGRLALPWVELVVLGVLTGLTVFSVLWLRYFQYGPVEWVWRNLTYLRVFPLRRPRPAA